MAIAAIAQMDFLSRVVDRVFLRGAGLEEVGALLLSLLGAVVVRAGLLWVREVTAQQGAVRVKSELRERLFAHVLRLGPAYTRGERTGELATIATEDIEKLEAYFSRYLPQVFLSAFVPLLIALYVLPLDQLGPVLDHRPGDPGPDGAGGQLRRGAPSAPVVGPTRLGASFVDALQSLPRLKVFSRGPESARSWRPRARSFGSAR